MFSYIPPTRLCYNRVSERETMLQRFVKTVGGNPHKRQLEQLSEEIKQINELEPEYEKLSDEALRAKTAEFRSRLPVFEDETVDEKRRFEAEQEALEDLLPEAFAAVREASK